MATIRDEAHNPLLPPERLQRLADGVEEDMREVFRLPMMTTSAQVTLSPQALEGLRKYVNQTYTVSRGNTLSGTATYWASDSDANVQARADPKQTPMWQDLRKRHGKFSIHEELMFEAPDQVMAILGECLVLECHYNYLHDCFEYEALSRRFDVVADGNPSPDYEWKFNGQLIEGVYRNP